MKANMDLMEDCRYCNTDNGIFFRCDCPRSTRFGVLSLFSRCYGCKQYTPETDTLTDNEVRINELQEERDILTEALREAYTAIVEKYNPILIDYASDDVVCNFCEGQGESDISMKHDLDCIVPKAQLWLKENKGE